MQISCSAPHWAPPPVTVKCLFDNAAHTSDDNPGHDSTLLIDPPLDNFSPWTDAAGMLIQTAPLQTTNGLPGQGGAGRSAATASISRATSPPAPG